MRPTLSIVLPCYNEAANLPELLRRFQPFGDRYPFELILVNNGSTDDTAAALARLLGDPAHRFARSHLVPVNQGYGYGILAGLRTATGDVLAYSHADLQCAPDDIFAAYDKWTASSDRERLLVKGRRLRRRPDEVLITRGLQWAATLILWMPLSDINGQPKVFPRAFLAQWTNPPRDFTFDLYVLYRARRAGWRIDTVPVDFGQRLHGVSHWAFSWRSKFRTIRGFLRYLARLRGETS